MIVVDESTLYPNTVAGKKNPIPNAKWSHLMSTLYGSKGTKELVVFSISIGLKKIWIQRKGTVYEHFDVTLSKRRLALKKGAIEINQRQMVHIIRAKKEGKNYEELGI